MNKVAMNILGQSTALGTHDNCESLLEFHSEDEV